MAAGNALRMLLALTALGAATPASALVVILNQGGGTVYAQQQLVSASPAADQALAEPPEAVTLTFSRSLRTQSSIKVMDSYGAPVTNGPVSVNGTSMSVQLQPLASGKYTVRWKARCMCSPQPDPPDLSDVYHFTVQ